MSNHIIVELSALCDTLPIFYSPVNIPVSKDALLLMSLHWLPHEEHSEILGPQTFHLDHAHLLQCSLNKDEVIN